MGDLPRWNDGLIMMGDLPRCKMMVSLWWVTYPNRRWSKYELVSLWWVTYPEKMMISLWWVTYPDEGGGLIMMGDLLIKMMISLWWVTYPGNMMVLLWWVTYPRKRWWSHYDGWPTQMKSERWSNYNGQPTQMKDERWSHYNRWPTQMQRFFQKKWSHCYGWPTQMEKCDLPDKKTWQVKSWQDKADKWRFLIARLTWRLLLMTRLISSFLWDSPISRVHLILFSFQDLNRFFVIINSMILSLSTILLDFIEDLPVTIQKFVQHLWG
jgi:hypothetical protein